MKNILILEDHDETMNRLVNIVGQAFSEAQVHCAYSIAEADRLTGTENFSLVLIDINLPDGSGIDYLSRMRQTAAASYFVITTMFDDDEHVFDALRQGAHGYILKEQTDAKIVQLLRGIIDGAPPLSPSVSRKILKFFNHVPEQRAAVDLSGRELEVLTLVAKGYTRKEIARLLEISVNTVSAYIKSVYKKLSVNNCSEATLEAVRLGLVAVDPDKPKPG